LPSGLTPYGAGMAILETIRCSDKPRWPHWVAQLVGKSLFWAAVNGHTFGIELLANSGARSDAILAPVNMVKPYKNIAIYLANLDLPEMQIKYAKKCT